MRASLIFAATVGLFASVAAGKIIPLPPKLEWYSEVDPGKTHNDTASSPANSTVTSLRARAVDYPGGFHDIWSDVPADKWIGVAGQTAYPAMLLKEGSDIATINIYHSTKKIWAIQITYRDGTYHSSGSTNWGGGKDSQWDTWELLVGEKITYMAAERNTDVNGVSGLFFRTNRGRTSPLWGKITLAKGNGLRHQMYGNSRTWGQRNTNPETNYIKGFGVSMYGSNLGLIAIQPLWKKDSGMRDRRLFQPDNTFSNYISNLVTVRRYHPITKFSTLKTVALRKIQFYAGDSSHPIGGFRETWYDGQNMIQGDAVGRTNTALLRTLEFAEGQMITKMEIYHNSRDVVYGLALYYYEYDRASNSWLQQVTPFIGSRTGTRSIIQAPNDQRLALFGLSAFLSDSGNLDNMLASIRPVWIEESPISMKVRVVDVNFSNVIQGEVKVMTTDNQEVVDWKNNVTTCQKLEKEWNKQVETSATVTRGTDWSTKVGFSIHAEMSVEVGSPLSPVGFEATAGWEAFTETSYSQSSESSWTTKEVHELKSKATFNVPPFTHFTGYSFFYEAKVPQTTWTGFLDVKYRSGETESIPVNGAFGGNDISGLFLSTDEVRLQPLPEGWSGC